MESGSDVNVTEEEKLRNKVETFEFFDGSDDEDDSEDEDEVNHVVVGHHVDEEETENEPLGE